jgi:hypothetical protein
MGAAGDSFVADRVVASGSGVHHEGVVVIARSGGTLALARVGHTLVVTGGPDPRVWINVDDRLRIVDVDGNVIADDGTEAPWAAASLPDGRVAYVSATDFFTARVGSASGPSGGDPALPVRAEASTVLAGPSDKEIVVGWTDEAGDTGGYDVCDTVRLVCRTIFEGPMGVLLDTPLGFLPALPR